MLPGLKIEVSTPGLSVGDEVKLVVAPTPQKGESVLDIINSLPGRRMFKTAEEVDRYLREERDSWD